MAENDGIWRTIKGVRVFIKDGQSLSEALAERKKEIQVKLTQQLEETIVKPEYKVLDKSGIAELQKQSDDVYSNLNFEQKNALDEYSCTAYSHITAFLNKKGPESVSYIGGKTMDVKKMADDIESSMENFTLTEDVVTFRGVNATRYENLEIGDTIIINHFPSTSLDMAVAKQYMEDRQSALMLMILVPKGTRSIYIGKNGSLGNEKELLLNRKLKYNVVERKKDILTLEVVTNE